MIQVKANLRGTPSTPSTELVLRGGSLHDGLNRVPWVPWYRIAANAGGLGAMVQMVVISARLGII
jgi:hypothetical protein